MKGCCNLRAYIVKLRCFWPEDIVPPTGSKSSLQILQIFEPNVFSACSLVPHTAHRKWLEHMKIQIIVSQSESSNEAMTAALTCPRVPGPINAASCFNDTYTKTHNCFISFIFVNITNRSSHHFGQHHNFQSGINDNMMSYNTNPYFFSWLESWVLNWCIFVIITCKTLSHSAWPESYFSHKCVQSNEIKYFFWKFLVHSTVKSSDSRRRFMEFFQVLHFHKCINLVQNIKCYPKNALKSSF